MFKYKMKNAKSGEVKTWDGCGVDLSDSHSKRVKMKHQLEKQTLFSL